MLWSDETTINRIGSDRKVYVWKTRGEPLSDHTTTPTVKHGGGNNLMVWGCMGWNGVGKFIEVEGKMDAKQYCEILNDGLMESFEKLDMEEGERYFQQDNNPKHTFQLATTWFSDNNIIVIHCPAQSPDLNPIEHLWFYVKHKLQEYEVPPKGAHELWERVAKEWNEITSEVCQGLIGSKPISMAMDLNAHFSTKQSPLLLNQVKKMKDIPYAEATGSVLWATVVSRPDTAFAVGVLSQFIQNLGPTHWEGVKRLISYLATMKELWLTSSGKKQSLLEGYSDSDWASQSSAKIIQPALAVFDVFGCL